MRRARILLLFGMPLMAACGVWPTGDDIDDSIQRELRSVDGDWSGETSGANPITIEVHLNESGTQVQGTGTMREQGGPLVPISVSGTFQRPALELTITGMSYGGRAVTGHLDASYNNIIVSTPLELTATGYSQNLQLIISED